jgi:hypothetical protein
MLLEHARLYRLMVRALLLALLAPYGVSAPTLARAVGAEEPVLAKFAAGGAKVVPLGDLRQTLGETSREPAYALHAPGTATLYAEIWDARPGDHQADRPGFPV